MGTAHQTSVAYMTDGYAGLLANSDADIAQTISRSNEGSTEMAFGLAVAFGTDPDRQCNLLAAQSGVVAGVVVASQAYDKTNELGTTGLKQNVHASVLRKGVIKVYCSEAVVVGTSAVRYRADTNGGTGALLGPGTFCVSSSSGHTCLVTSGMKWVKGCDAAGYAWLSVDMDAFAKTND